MDESVWLTLLYDFFLFVHFDKRFSTMWAYGELRRTLSIT